MMGTKLERIAEISAQSKRPNFTSLYHLINAELLKQCHRELDGKKAVGIDEVTKEKYSEALDSNIEDLVLRLKNKAYKPLPTRRVFIPKQNGKMRPLGIVSYEDKIVQLALKKVLEAVYEPRFLNCMYGFRPKRGCHEAVKDVYQHLSHGKINYIVDADVKGFFDHIDHEWMMKFIEWHIKDPNILWLIRKYLKAGVMVDGVYEDTEEGTIQGGNISPTLANIYMHNVLTLWFKLVIQKEVKGECFLVNYADDFVAGFQYKSEAEMYYAKLKERMAHFNLELEDSKSRLIEFGRFAEQNRKAKGLGKPETFDFLGFTFFMGKSRKGYPLPKVKTSRKKFEKSLKSFKTWLYANKEQPAQMIVGQLNVKLVGYYRYYGVSFNSYKLVAFLHRVQQFLYKVMNRRGCRRTYTWNGFVDMLKVYPLAKPKIYFALY
jgi:group II intron reverse transcriptase/maturase